LWVVFKSETQVMVSERARELYRALIFAGRQHPDGLSAVRERVKKEFFKTKDVEDKKEIRKAFRYGWWMVEELNRIAQFHKYRAMKKRYE